MIAARAERLTVDRIAVEFRNKSWFAEKHLAATIAFEGEHNLIQVVVDEPQRFASSVPAAWEDTSPHTGHGPPAQAQSRDLGKEGHLYRGTLQLPLLGPRATGHLGKCQRPRLTSQRAARTLQQLLPR